MFAKINMATPKKRPLLDFNTPSPKRARKEMKLVDKINLIKESETVPKPTQAELSKKYGIGKSTVCDILKNKEKYKTEWEQNSSKSKVRIGYSCKYGDVNDLTFKWFEQARGKNVPISGPLICEKAVSIAESLGISDFKASAGWLTSFKSRQNIKFFKICGESADVDCEVVDDYRLRIPDITKDYSPDNIFNCDETALFYRTLPDKTLSVKTAECKGGKLSKDRVTVLLCCSATGEKYKPLVIGKALNPRCFKNVKVAELPVSWKSNKKAWMTRVVFAVCTSFGP